MYQRKTRDNRADKRHFAQDLVYRRFFVAAICEIREFAVRSPLGA